MFHLLYTLLLCGMPAKLHELKIGDRVPDQVIRHVVNYKSSTIRLSDYNGKMILFDFGGSTCPPCLKLLEHLDSLQVAYKDRIQIFFVSFEETDKFLAAMKRSPRLRSATNIPMITADTSLSKQFKHTYYPHEAWVSPEGVLVAQTEADYVTKENIDKILAGEKIVWLLKHEVDYNPDEPMVTPNEKTGVDAQVMSATRPLLYTAFSGSIEGVSPSSRKAVNTASGITRMSMINMPIVAMYLEVNGHYTSDWPRSKIIIESKESARFYKPLNEYRQAWEKDNWYCFETSYPSGLTEEQAQRRLTNTLDIYLSMRARFEERQLECWIIRKGPNAEDYLKKTYTKQVAKARKDSTGEISFENPNVVAWTLNFEGQHPPVFDETGFSTDDNKDHYMGHVLDRDDFDSIREKLHGYGLDLQKEKRLVKVFVITDGN